VDGIEEALAVQLALGDDRAIRATYVGGTLAWDRDAPSSSGTAAHRGVEL